MPAGCEFICKNKDCVAFDTGFSISAPWPMAKIKIIINSSALKDKEKFKDKLIELKNSGREYALIQYPNIDKIQPEKYRIQMWSDEAKCIFDFQVEQNDIIDNNIYEKYNICPLTNTKMRTFNEVCIDGIKCPHCKEKLTQSRWFTNEN